MMRTNARGFVVMMRALATRIVREDMYAQVNTKTNKQYCRHIANPLLDSVQTLRQSAQRYGAIRNEPCHYHNGQTRTQTKHHWQKPVPTHRQRDRYIHHREEIHQAVRTKSNGKEDTQHKRPKTATLTIHMLQPFAHSVVMLVVMMTREKQ